MPVFLTANNLKPFISKELIENSTPVDFTDLNGNKSIGYKAEILASICYVFIDALEAGELLPNQIHIAERCKILVRGFATLGIIALVDEATGYQYDREKDELQKILKAYISEELIPWQKRFPDEFYKEIFRLNKWDFTVTSIKNRPGVIGTWTKKLIYNLLPKGVLEELEKKTPKSAAGNKTARLHQSLTLNIGEPHLEKQLISVITLMNISENWDEFLRLFGKKFQKDLIEIAQSSFKVNKKSGKNLTGQQYLFENVDLEELDRPHQKSLFDKNLTGLLNTPPPKKDNS